MCDRSNALARPGMTPAMTSIPGHFQISQPAVAALEADRPLPLAKARSHPALCIQRDSLDRKREAGDCDVPRDRNLTSFDLGQSCRRHAVIGRRDFGGTAAWLDPVAEKIVVAILLTQPIQHELFA